MYGKVVGQWTLSGGYCPLEFIRSKTSMTFQCNTTSVTCTGFQRWGEGDDGRGGERVGTISKI